MVQINTMKAQTEVKERENKLKSRHKERYRGRGLGYGRLSATQRDRLAQVLRERETGKKKKKQGIYTGKVRLKRNRQH